MYTRKHMFFRCITSRPLCQINKGIKQLLSVTASTNVTKYPPFFGITCYGFRAALNYPLYVHYEIVRRGIQACLLNTIYLEDLFRSKRFVKVCCKGYLIMLQEFERNEGRVQGTRFWVEKGKVVLHKIHKDILETIFTRTITFNSTVIVTISRVDTWPILSQYLS